MALKQGQLLMSLATLEELYEVLGREKFKKYITETERSEFIGALVREATFVNVTEHITACRDPKDNRFLELAVEGNAACIISDDEDLLVLHPFRGIPILTPRQFLDEWQDEGES